MQSRGGEGRSYVDAADMRLTRKELLRAGAGGAVLLSSGGLARTAAAALDAETPRRGGTLRIGIGGGGPTDDFDAAHINGPSTTTRAEIFYETVTYLDNRFRMHRDFLCDEFVPNKTGTEWTVRLKPHVEFHNGKTATADDLLFTIRRILNPKTAAIAAGQLTGIDLKRTRKLDARTVRFALHAPTSFFDQLMSDIVYLLPVGYDPKHPISTGPWKFVSFQPGKQTVLDRFENYHGTPAYADRLLIVELPDDSARVNALISGQVDAINQVPYAQIPVLKKNSKIDVVISQTGGWNPITMRTDKPPFDDVRVRQAIRLLMDRNQAVATALLGQGVPASDHYGRFDPVYDASLVRHRDVPRAKSLLKAAGRENLGLELVMTPLAAGIVEACQVLAANAKDAGVKIKLRQVDIGTYFSQYGKWPFAIDYWPGLPYLVVASIKDANGPTVSNVTYFEDPKLKSLFRAASAELDLQKRKQIAHEMQKIQFDRGGDIIWSFGNTVDAYSTKLGGVIPVDETGWGLGRCNVEKLYFKA
jgi:peptide/nickel transport system substrate-binding protein